MSEQRTADAAEMIRRDQARAEREVGRSHSRGLSTRDAGVYYQASTAHEGLRVVEVAVAGRTKRSIWMRERPAGSGRPFGGLLKIERAFSRLGHRTPEAAAVSAVLAVEKRARRLEAEAAEARDTADRARLTLPLVLGLGR